MGNGAPAVSARNSISFPVILASLATLALTCPSAPAAQPLVPNRFIQEWLVTGPFDNPAFSPLAPLDVPFILDEEHLKPRAGDVLAYRGQSLSWMPLNAGVIDFDPVLSGTTGRTISCAYAFAEVECAEAGDWALVPMFADGAKLWVNGELVFSMAEPFDPDQAKDRVVARFHKGRNSITAKVTTRLSLWGWGLFVEPVHGLTIRVREKRSHVAFPSHPLPEATLVIHDARSSATLTTPLSGFGGIYRAVVRPPRLDFEPGEAAISVAPSPGYPGHQETLKRLESAAPGTAEYEFEMKYSGVLAGRVADRLTGAPVAGAQVRIGREQRVAVESDETGVFEFDNALPGRLLLQVLAPGYHPWRGNFPRRGDDGFNQLQILLMPANRTIYGQIINGWTGQGIPDAEITYDFGAPGDMSVLTGNEGRFDIDFNSERLIRFWANVRVDGFHFPSFGLPYRYTLMDLEPRLELRPVQMNVTARLQGGEAWSSATVTLFHYLFPDGQMAKTAVTDARGKAAFPMLPEGMYLLAAHDAARGLTAQRIELSGQVVEAVVKAPDGEPVNMHIQDSGGRPAAGAMLMARAYGSDSPAVLTLAGDADGRLILPSMAAETIHLSVEHPALPRLVYTGPLDQIPKDWRAPLPRRLVMEVVGEEDGRLIADAMILLRHSDREAEAASELNAEVVRAADGRLALVTHQAPADVSGWSVLVKSPGYSGRLIALDELARQAVASDPVRLALPRAAERDIQFLSPAGAETSHVSVAWFRPEFPLRGDSKVMVPEPLVLNSGSQAAGRIVPPVGDADGWRKLVWKPYYGFAILEAGEAWPRFVRLGQFARLSGRILLTGQPRQDAYVKAIAAGDLAARGLQLMRTTRMRSGGWFEFTDLIPGPWRLEVYHGTADFGELLDTGPVFTMNVVAQAMVSTYVEVPREEAGNLSGRVMDAQGEPVFAAIILERRGREAEAYERIRLITDWEGRFLMDGLSRGRWKWSVFPRYSNWGRPYFTDFTRELTGEFMIDNKQHLEQTIVFDK